MLQLNDLTVDVLAGYLGSAQSRDLQMLRLDSTGITGRQMAKLFWAMGPSREVTVHANASRLDEGIDELCDVLADGYGPWSLFMQMVEFNQESNYIKLWRALTVNTSIECLSLAGSSIPDEASSAACQTVADFFAKNDTVRFLDISGYNAKLDEGRLGKRFSSSLIGMRRNTRIEHLRVRNQMLNVNIGDLAEAMSGNTTLHTLDCEDNGFNLSNFRHLIKHLDDNTTICNFSAFTPSELQRVVRKPSAFTPGTTAAPPTRRASIVSRFRQERPQSSGDKALVQHLKDEWDAALEDLRLIMERNNQKRRLLIDESTMASPEYSEDEPVTTATTSLDEGVRDGGEECVFSKAFGGLAAPQRQPRHGKSIADLQGMVGRLDTRNVSSIRRSSSTASSSDAAAVSPTSASGSISPARTPPDDVPDSPKRTLSLRNPDSGSGSSFDYSVDGHYTYAYGDGPHGGPSPADVGLQMKAFRRTWGDSVSRIDEEDDATCAA